MLNSSPSPTTMARLTLSLFSSALILSTYFFPPICVMAAPYNHSSVPFDDAVPATHVRRNIFGPIATDKPEPAGGTVANTAPPLASFFVDMNPPYPTNTWWSGYAATPGTAIVAGPFPYESNLIGSGIVFGVSTDRQWDGTSIKQPTQSDWSMGFAEHSGDFSDHKATAFDTQSVTLQYFTGSSTMTGYMIPGSPYLTFQFSDATPVLTSQNGLITSFAGTTLSSGENATATGTEFLVTNSAGTYIIYSLSGSITMTAASGPTEYPTTGIVQASVPLSGVLRVVKLNETSHKTLLDEYVTNYPISVGTDYSFTDTTGTLIFNWDVVGTASSLLMLTWPHHRQKLVSPAQSTWPSTSSLSYLTTKGYMYPIIGSQWQMTYDLTPITWNPDRDVDSSCMGGLITGLEYEIGQLNASEPSVPGDFYYWGGAANAQARLAIIADFVGRSDLIDQVIAYLEASFQYWFESTSSTLPAYESGWGGIIDAGGYDNVNVDFGNGFYNDHHFHYGYFLAVAAVIAKYDNNWLSEHQTYINWFLRDIVNPTPADPYFPVTRCRDWFAGHSWASGIANGAGSRDQESTGEAINGYYGAMLWSSVIGDTDMVHYSQLLIASEQQAAQVYWHLYPSQSPTDLDNPYPEADVRALVTMGNVEDWQSGAWLFWGAETVEIAAIQMLPIIPVNEYLYDSEWVQNVWSYTSSEMNNASYSDDWRSVIVAAYSNYDPQTAAQWSSQLTTWGTGNTFSNQQYFVATRPNPSGAAICDSSSQSNPTGNFYLRATTGKFVAASASNTNLMATGASAAEAAIFNGAYVPNAGTLQLNSTGQFVTADDSGDYALAAARVVASTWEQFIVRQKSGAPGGVYSIKAISNSLYIVLNSDGSLINSGATEADSMGFYFISA